MDLLKSMRSLRLPSRCGELEKQIFREMGVLLNADTIFCFVSDWLHSTDILLEPREYSLHT
jgi:hypothetical protein